MRWGISLSSRDTCFDHQGAVSDIKMQIVTRYLPLFICPERLIRQVAGGGRAEDQRTAQRDKSCEAIKYLCQQHRTIIAGIQRICFSHTGLAMAVIDMNFISCSEQLMAALVSLAHLT